MTAASSTLVAAIAAHMTTSIRGKSVQAPLIIDDPSSKGPIDSESLRVWYDTQRKPARPVESHFTNMVP